MHIIQISWYFCLSLAERRNKSTLMKLWYVLFFLLKSCENLIAKNIVYLLIQNICAPLFCWSTASRWWPLGLIIYFTLCMCMEAGNGEPKLFMFIFCLDNSCRMRKIPPPTHTHHLIYIFPVSQRCCSGLHFMGPRVPLPSWALPTIIPIFKIVFEITFNILAFYFPPVLGNSW